MEVIGQQRALAALSRGHNTTGALGI